MKIETLTINFAVADRISRDNINELLAEFVASVQNIGFYGIELEGDDGKHTTTSAANVPRKKRKYTRHVKPTEGDSKRTTASSPAEESGVKVTRRKMADGTTIENRGNCQGGGTV